MLFSRPGLSGGLEARCLGYSTPGGVSDCAVALTLDKSLLFARCGSGGDALTERLHLLPLTTLAMHPEDPQVTVSNNQGVLISWYMPVEFGPGFLSSSANASAGAGAGAGGVLTAQPAASSRSSSAHWHAHAAWAACYTPDASFLLSGGEESTVVMWQLGRASGGGGFPARTRRV